METRKYLPVVFGVALVAALMQLIARPVTGEAANVSKPLVSDVAPCREDCQISIIFERGQVNTYCKPNGNWSCAVDPEEEGGAEQVDPAAHVNGTVYERFGGTVH